MFADVDKDHNNSVSNVEMETLVLEIIGTGKLKIDQKFAVSEIMKTFDGDGNSRIGEEEFIAGCKRWIEETPQPSENSDPSKNIFHEASYPSHLNPINISANASDMLTVKLAANHFLN